MATRGIDLLVSFTVWDTVNNVGKTGDRFNLTMQWFKTNGGVGAITEYPGVAVSELDPGKAPGLYYLDLGALETDVDMGILCGVSISEGVSVIPTTIQFERLPDQAPNVQGGVRDVWMIAGSNASALKLRDQIGAIESGTIQSVAGVDTVIEAPADTDLDVTEMVILIVSGGGITQTRHITAYNNVTFTAAVDRIWDIDPTGMNYHILGLIL